MSKVSPKFRRFSNREGAPQSLESVERLALRALDAGGIHHSTRLVEWDVSGVCSSPVTVERYSSATEKIRRRKRPDKERPSMTVILHTPCRRCPECARLRSKHWHRRAKAECQAAIARGARTWFGTLTWSHDRHVQADAEIVLGRADKAGVMRGAVPHFDALPETEKFAHRARNMGREVTLFLKRVRTNGAVPIRYLAACEMHSGDGLNHGLPHWHLLIHEMDAGQPLRHKVLTTAWRGGFCNFKIARDTVGAAYLTKYLSKSLDARVRASEGYGDTAVSEISDFRLDALGA